MQAKCKLEEELILASREVISSLDLQTNVFVSHLSPLIVHLFCPSILAYITIYSGKKLWNEKKKCKLTSETGRKKKKNLKKISSTMLGFKHS